VFIYPAVSALTLLFGCQKDHPAFRPVQILLSSLQSFSSRNIQRRLLEMAFRIALCVVTSTMAQFVC